MFKNRAINDLSKKRELFLIKNSLRENVIKTGGERENELVTRLPSPRFSFLIISLTHNRTTFAPSRPLTPQI